MLSYPRLSGGMLPLKIHADVFSKNELGIEAVAAAVAVAAVVVVAAVAAAVAAAVEA
jgi:hypothetical protein